MKTAQHISNAELARQLIRQCPNAPALTLAKRLYRENQARFSNLEAARASIRYALGVTGKQHRKDAIKSSETYREQRQPGAVFDLLPTPKHVFDAPWCAVPIEGKRRTLLLQDIHIPFYDKAALELAINTGIDRGCDTVLLNGDIGDFYSISDWDRSPDVTRLVDEINDIKHFLGFLRREFPKARLIWKDGNHEERFWRYLRVKAPEFWGIPEFTLRTMIGLDEHAVEYIGDMRPILLGKLFVLHGHEYRFPISNPVNPARGLFLRAKTLACCGHFHISSQHQERDLAGKVISCWSIGALCDLHPAYRPLNGWSHGFAIVETDDDGAFHMENLRIIDGKVY